MSHSPALAVAVIGLAGPFLVRAITRQRPLAPLAVVAAHLAALLVAWGGLLGLLGHRHLLGLCEVLLASLWASPAPLARVTATALVLALPGRAVLSVLASVAAHRRLRRALAPGPRMGPLRRREGLGTAAVTVGLLRPVVVWDPALLPVLHPQERRAVLSHERTHARGRHAVIVAVVEGLAAGLRPWPGAAAARSEVRMHLEAHADQRAARATSSRTVARAILATGSSTAPTPALGMSGWPVWRAERLLSRRRSPAAALVGASVAAFAAVAAVVGLQGSAHALWGSHVVPALHVVC